MARSILLVSPRFTRWADMSAERWAGEQLIGFRPPPGCPGVLLVFDSFEALLAVYPDAELSQVLTFEAPP